MGKNMKKRIIIISISLLIIYFSYKIFILKYYDIEKFSNLLDFNYKDKITIKHKDIDDNSYLKFKNLKIRNDFKLYQNLDQIVDENSSSKLVLKDTNNKVIKAFWMGYTNTYLDLLKSDKTFFGQSNIKIIKNINIEDILKMHKISNDILLFDYLLNNKNNNNNIFTSVKKIKENYTIYSISSIMIPENISITLIDGDYKGYIFNLKDNIREVNILKDDKRYTFTFMDTNNVDNEYLNDILNTVVVE